MKHVLFIVVIWIIFVISPACIYALTPLTGEELQYGEKTDKVRPAPDINPVLPVASDKPVLVSSRRSAEQELPDVSYIWISDVGKLYIKDKLSEEELAAIFDILEKNLGIRPDGSLDIVKAREAMTALHKYSEDPDKEFSNIYFDDKQNLTGYNFVYFEMCTVYKDNEGERFKRYFEKGFYPNRNLYTKEEYYYKSLYYYLLVCQNSLIHKISKAVEFMNAEADKEPPFTRQDILTFETTVNVCSELEEFRIKSASVIDSPYERIFTPEDRAGISESVKYFTGIETHNALLSYPWFRANLPLSISAQVVAQDVRETWIEQTMAHRATLPLMLFSSHGDTVNSYHFNVDKLFNDTLSTLKLDNREVDMVSMSALKTWLTKQVEHGIRIEDRLKYKDLLDELNVCPTGWIFYNLYGCRAPLEELKTYAGTWDSYPEAKRKELFSSKISLLYADALDKIEQVFSELEKLFGPVQGLGNDRNSAGINHIFFRYRGEISYFFEYLQFGIHDKNPTSARFPLANSKKNCLMDFKAAFTNDTTKKINHENLLNAYDLLFKELASQGKVSEIMKYEDEMESFINNRSYLLGSLVSHKNDNRYNIYRIIANSYLSNKQLQTRALQAAEKSYMLSRNYYVKEASAAGYMYDSIPGALNTRCTQIDDLERQFEFYQDTALKLGKKIWLLLPAEDIELYNRLQDLRNPEGVSL